MSEKPLIAFIATYDDRAVARQDYEEVKQAHSRGFIGKYDAAVLWKDDNAKVHVDTIGEEASRNWLLAGLGIGALVGLIFPPSILATSAIGALGGAVIGKFRDGIRPQDLQQVGDALTGDNAALVVLAQERVSDALQQIGARLDASRLQVEVTLSDSAAEAAEQLQQAIAQASTQLGELAEADATRERDGEPRQDAADPT